MGVILMDNPGMWDPKMCVSHLFLVPPSGNLLEEVSWVYLGWCQIRDHPPTSFLELPLKKKKMNSSN